MAIAGRGIQGTTIISGAAQTLNDLGRNTLQDDAVLTTSGPIVVAAPLARIWTNKNTPFTSVAPFIPPPQPPPIEPIVVTAQNLEPFYRQQGWGVPVSDQNLGPIYRSTLQDPPVLTTPGPIVVAAPYATRWFDKKIPLLGVAPVIPPIFVRQPLQLGGVAVNQNMLGGSFSIPLSLGGSATVVDPHLGGTTTVVAIGGNVTPVLVNGNTVVVDLVDSTLVGWSMQEVDIVLGEFNDVTINLALTTTGGGALNLTGYTSVDMFLKVAAGVADSDITTLKLSSTGGSPAITITNASGGLATVALPATDLTASNAWTFYRVDAVDPTGHRNTAIFGKVSVTQL